MKYIKANLLSSVTGTYDQTKTTIKGRVYQKTINATDVLGPPQAKFMDVFTDTGIAPSAMCCPTDNGRIFVLGTITAGVGTLFLYDFDYSNGTNSYVGKITFAMPNTAATTHTIKGMKCKDSGVTGWKLYLTTAGSVVINGGVFVLNSVDKADFTPSGTNLAFATSTDQKAVYFLQNPAAIGVSQAETTSNGLIIDLTNNKLYNHNGIAATHQYHVRDITASLTWTSASVSISVASPGKVTYTSHPFLANDPIIFSAGTVPTGLTIGTVYFVRNPTANDFEVSATTGGASINTSGSPGSATCGRAFATTGDSFLYKTGNLPALAGTLLTNGSESLAIPVSSPLNGGVLNGNHCAHFATTTNHYLGLLSELTSGVTTWPSLTTSNTSGAVNQITIVTPVFASWSNELDHAIFSFSGTRFVAKQLINTYITSTFGQQSNTILVAAPTNVIEFGLMTLLFQTMNQGWLFLIGGTTGQTGILAIDLYAAQLFDYSYLVTPVMDIPNSQLAFVKTLEQIVTQTGKPKIEYRMSGFGSITGGWTELDPFADLTSISTSSQIQFKVSSSILTYSAPVGTQLSELIVGLNPNNDISDNFEYSHDNSSSGTPTRCAFRLKKAYATSVPTLHFRAYDLSDLLLVHHTTAANPSYFEYSTDGGIVWNPLGTIPNTVGTLVRYSFSSPPGVDIRPGLKED